MAQWQRLSGAECSKGTADAVDFTDMELSHRYHFCAGQKEEENSRCTCSLLYECEPCLMFFSCNECEPWMPFSHSLCASHPCCCLDEYERNRISAYRLILFYCKSPSFLISSARVVFLRSLSKFSQWLIATRNLCILLRRSWH